MLNRKKVIQEMEAVTDESLTNQVRKDRALAWDSHKQLQEFHDEAYTAFIKELADALERPVKSIHSRDRIDSLFAGKVGKEKLQKLYNNTKFDLPELEYSERSNQLLTAFWILGITGFLILITCITVSLGRSSEANNGFLTLLYLGSGTLLLSLPCFCVYRKFIIGKQIPDRFSNVGELAHMVAQRSSRNAITEWKKERGLNDIVQPLDSHLDDIWQHLLRIIAEVLGVSEDQLTPESDFVRDLGVG